MHLPILIADILDPLLQPLNTHRSRRWTLLVAFPAGHIQEMAGSVIPWGLPDWREDMGWVVGAVLLTSKPAER